MIQKQARYLKKCPYMLEIILVALLETIRQTQANIY